MLTMPPRHHRQTRDNPNVDFPLTEPTINRRVWAAYLRAGYTRARFARELGIAYPTLDRSDTGKTTLELDTLMLASTLVGYTMDEICFGAAGRPRASAEPELSHEEQKSLLHDDLRASLAEMETLAQYQASPSGKFTRYTRSYISRFIQSVRLALDAGSTQLVAIDTAKVDAANEAATAAVQAAQLAPPLTAEGHAALGRIVSGTARVSKRLKPEAPARPKRKRA